MAQYPMKTFLKNQKRAVSQNKEGVISWLLYIKKTYNGQAMVLLLDDKRLYSIQDG